MDKLYMKDFPGRKLRVALVCEDPQTNPGNKIKALSDSKEAYEYIRQGLENKDREFFVAILLNRKNVPLGVNLVSMGSLSATTVHPREVYKPAILASAAALIVAHNHPSGDPRPSLDDEKLTRNLAEAGQILEIELLDHMIVGSDSFYSFRDEGVLPLDKRRW